MKNSKMQIRLKQQATMEIYRKAGINQMAGCLPALVQIPIFYALFRFLPI
jgi:YidC/Oxa1 family membrane protein insertase